MQPRNRHTKVELGGGGRPYGGEKRHQKRGRNFHIVKKQGSRRDIIILSQNFKKGGNGTRINGNIIAGGSGNQLLIQTGFVPIR